ncbi:MAG: nucleotidyl transferase AbiEii/AbiGii toxin family protein, partial [Bacilli bacterium]|nr:nucleotidyl transferase AbiEii/AbiGii toxin family protein [Bacilli bacterium]
MKLHNDPKIFKELIVATAQNSKGLQNFQVEKDYFVSLFLKELSKTNKDLEVVFKGGTSLSKCYDVINRFSEDVDLTIKLDNKKANYQIKKQFKNKIISSIENLGMVFLNPLNVESKKNYNYYEVEFKKHFESTPEIIPFIKIETITAYKPYPCKKLLVSNYITKFLREIEEGEELIKKYELEEFEMNIQTVERTFIDKLFALCDYYLSKNYFRNSRHIYDIHMIWNSGLLNKKVVSNIVDDVLADRQRFSNKNLSSKPGSKPKDILLEIVETGVFK